MYPAKMGAGRGNTSGRDVLVPTRAGLYCPAGDFHIDPTAGVDRAVITHAHADHARPGSRRYLASRESLPLLRERLGKVELGGLEYGRPIRLGKAWVSLHPAGHILGSAQVRVEVGRLTAQPVHLHPQVEAMTAHYRAAGVRFGPTEPLAPDRQFPPGALAILPPAAARAQLAGLEVATGLVSGWMAVPKRRRGSVGFVVSDHADWPALVATVRATGARRVLVTHGDGTVLARYLREQLGVDAELLAAG